MLLVSHRSVGNVRSSMPPKTKTLNICLCSKMRNPDETEVTAVLQRGEILSTRWTLVYGLIGLEGFVSPSVLL